jgi:hypothetical protein
VVRNKELKLEDDEASHTLGGVGKGIPKEREVDRSREVCERERYECTRESIGATSMFRLIHRTIPLARMLPTLTCLHKIRFTVAECLKVTPPWRGRLPRNETGV